MTQKPERCRSLVSMRRIPEPQNRRQISPLAPMRNLQPAIIHPIFPFFKDGARGHFQTLRVLQPRITVSHDTKTGNIRSLHACPRPAVPGFLPSRPHIVRASLNPAQHPDRNLFCRTLNPDAPSAFCLELTRRCLPAVAGRKFRLRRPANPLFVSLPPLPGNV